MVDAEMLGLVEAALLGVFEVGDVQDVGHWVLISGGASILVLIVFIVQEDVLVPFRVDEPALMGVGGTDVAELAEHSALVDTGLLSGVVDGECILVVAEADIL